MKEDCLTLYFKKQKDFERELETTHFLKYPNFKKSLQMDPNNLQQALWNKPWSAKGRNWMFWPKRLIFDSQKKFFFTKPKQLTNFIINLIAKLLVILVIPIADSLVIAFHQIFHPFKHLVAQTNKTRRFSS